jgi:phosphoglycolate phosphatase
MKYLLWDIDGTLMLTNFAGVNAMKQTVKELYGIDRFTFTYNMSGRTDSFITRKAIEEITGHCTAEDIRKFIDVYAKLLPQSLTERQGHLLPYVESCLQWVQKSSNMTSLLLTGNCEKAAHAKLEHFHIDQYFDYRLSAFGEISEMREDLSRALWQKLQKANPGIQTEDAIVIGDTPHDITCAAAIGVRCLIVRHGSTYKDEDLVKYNPWKIIDKLPSRPEELAHLFEETCYDEKM